MYQTVHTRGIYSSPNPAYPPEIVSDLTTGPLRRGEQAVLEHLNLWYEPFGPYHGEQKLSRAWDPPERETLNEYSTVVREPVDDVCKYYDDYSAPTYSV